MWAFLVAAGGLSSCGHGLSCSELKGIGGLGTEATERFSKSMEPGAKVCRLTPSARYLEL